MFINIRYWSCGLSVNRSRVSGGNLVMKLKQRPGHKALRERKFTFGNTVGLKVNRSFLSFITSAFLIVHISGFAYAQSPYADVLKVKPGKLVTSGVDVLKNRIKIPHPVKGLVILPNDPLIRSVTLSWKANPISDEVDKYAIYLLDTAFPQYTRELVTVTAKTQISLQTWTPSRRTVIQKRGTIFLVPNADLKMYVIAHNKYGWGVAMKGARYPDNSKQSALSNAQIAEFAPTVGYGEWKCSKAIEKYYSTKC